MNRELLQTMQDMYMKNVEVRLAIQCAPLLMGIKISNLFIVSMMDEGKVTEVFQNTSIKSFVIYHSAEKCVFFLYREQELEESFKQQKIKFMLGQLGYSLQNSGDVLRKLAGRYEDYMEKRSGFPHEIGLLLGYPPEDVLGFIENEGKKFLYTGYWKVYANLTETMAVFEAYNQAKQRIMQMLYEGSSLQKIIEKAGLLDTESVG